MNRVEVMVRDRRLIVAAWLTVRLFRILILLVGFRRLTWLFPPRMESPPPSLVRRIVAAVTSVSNQENGATCLVQACAVRALLGLKGYSVTMRVGVREADEGRLTAHAWLVSNEEILFGAANDDVQRFRPIADYR